MAERREEEFRRKLLATFRVEAAEHVAGLASGIVELERAVDAAARARVVETVFRAAHSLKGAARAVNAAAIESLCQATEGVLAALKRRTLESSPALLDLLHESIDTLERLLDALASGSGAEPTSELLRRLETAAKGTVTVPAPVENKPPPLPETAAKPQSTPVVRIDTARLDALLLQAEEMLSAKLAAADLAKQMRAALAEVTSLRRVQGRVSAPRRADADPDRLKALESRMQALCAASHADARTLGGMVDALLGDMKKALMLPIASVLEMFPRLVRELARDQGKDVELVVRGAETEVDRRILDEMRDPLIHMVRNAVDHGIEKPEARRAARKEPRGRIRLSVSPREGNQLEIVLADDGAGIDPQRLRAAAVAAGIPEADAVADALPLVFESGVSTSEMITDLSGRGLGLAIVAEKVERLGGSVRVESRHGEGTTFHILLPVTLSTFRGVQVRLDDQAFVLPTSQVAQVGRVRRDSIRMVKNRPTIAWNGEAIPLVRLSDALGIAVRTPAANGSLHVVVVGSAERRIALAVDEVLGEQEVLVKPLGKLLPRVRNLAGATVLPGGKSVPILHVPELVRSAVAAANGASFDTPAARPEARAKSILVAEDSVTSRALLKNILEAAGYRVVVAVDGFDAFTRLRTEPYDLVVSDVEMPRLNGFELTRKMRADERLSRIPVVLVTALGSREDRERGAEAGANAYIVKSSFDQSNLLDAVRRLA